MHYFTPHTPDGIIETIHFDAPGLFHCTARFSMPEAFRRRIDHGASALFAARSRICRLGIAVNPAAEVRFESDHCHIDLRGRSLIPSYQLEPLLAECLVPGVGIGRLVACDPADRCGADEIHASLGAREMLLPRGYSLNSDGSVEFPPQFCVYEFGVPVTCDQLFTIFNRNYGKDLLNALQSRRNVDALVLQPGHGVITSCAMFLNQHYLVLDTESSESAAHLSARVLDPLETRLSKVFLEFVNTSSSVVVNPRARARIYRADRAAYPRRSMVAVGDVPPKDAPRAAFEQVEALFQTARKLSGDAPGRVICEHEDAPMALAEVATGLVSGMGGARCALHAPRRSLHRSPEAMRLRARDLSERHRIPTDRPVTLFSEFFRLQPLCLVNFAMCHLSS